MDRLINLGTLLDNTLGVVNAYENRYGKLENHGKAVDPYEPPDDGVPPETDETQDGLKPRDNPSITWQGWLGLAVILIVLIIMAIAIGG